MFRETHVQRLNVRVEFRLVRGRQRGTHVISLGSEQLLRLLSLRGGLLPNRPERRGVAALSSVARRLRLRLELLAQRFHLRRVFGLNVLEVRLFGVAECDALEELTAKTASTLEPVRAVGT